MSPRKVNPPHYFFGALLSMLGLGAWLPGHVMPAPWHWIGLVPLAAGVLLAAVAAGHFAKAGTNIVPLTRSTVLVTHGPFARTRNPMYLGMTLTLAGVALIQNSPWPWLVVAAFVAILQLRFIRHEEALMEQTFGDDYRAYRERVRRWL